MSAKLNHKILKRIFCFIAIIISHQVFQVNTYSSENHIFNLNHVIDKQGPTLLKVENELGAYYIVSSYYY